MKPTFEQIVEFYKLKEEHIEPFREFINDTTKDIFQIDDDHFVAKVNNEPVYCRVTFNSR